MRKAKVYLQKELAGFLTENEDGYSFLYDMVASILVVEGDSEELALTLNGKKKKIKKKDFVEAMVRFHVDNKAIENMFNKFNSSIDTWHKFIDISFLPDDMKNSFHHLINERVSRIYNSL